jgi:hypothetical protein
MASGVRVDQNTSRRLASLAARANRRLRRAEARHERQQTIERASVTESNHAPSARPRLTD